MYFKIKYYFFNLKLKILWKQAPFLFIFCILMGLFLLLNTEFKLVEIKLPMLLINQNFPTDLS